MAYTNKQSTRELNCPKDNANKITASTFADQRISTGVQLKQQHMMNSSSNTAQMQTAKNFQRKNINTTPIHQFNNPYSINSSPNYTVQLLTDEKLVNTKNFGQAYYQFDYDSSGNIDDFSNNRATKTPVGADPVDASSHVNLDEGSGSGQGEMLSGKEVDIATGTRSQHFSIADRLVDGTPDDRKGTYTWHHLTPEYEMVLVDMGVHAAFGHKGGKSFWK